MTLKEIKKEKSRVRIDIEARRSKIIGITEGLLPFCKSPITIFKNRNLVSYIHSTLSLSEGIMIGLRLIKLIKKYLRK